MLWVAAYAQILWIKIGVCEFGGVIKLYAFGLLGYVQCDKPPVYLLEYSTAIVGLCDMTLPDWWLGRVRLGCAAGRRVGR